ncbi:hypothetical protein B0H16DRAFT_1479218 [Mycena metata]|uniref:Uncharacterized protein n=1 Tax=Mycena metata TaxID=1033252 RepID=A0AAD7H5P2_9AGAR|nr:hypothetical protein B0H16DRAFT_1479218 [Mycena metata]
MPAAPYSLIKDPALHLPVTLSAPDALRHINREPNLGRQIGLQLANQGPKCMIYSRNGGSRRLNFLLPPNLQQSGWAFARSSHTNNLSSYRIAMGKKWSDPIKQKFVVWLATDESQKISLGRIKADNLLGHGSPGLLQDPKTTWDLKMQEFTGDATQRPHLLDKHGDRLDFRKIWRMCLLINAGGTISKEELLADINDASKWPSSAVPIVKKLDVNFGRNFGIRFTCSDSERELVAEQGGLAFPSEIACRPNFPAALVTQLVRQKMLPLHNYWWAMATMDVYAIGDKFSSIEVSWLSNELGGIEKRANLEGTEQMRATHLALQDNEESTNKKQYIKFLIFHISVLSFGMD